RSVADAAPRGATEVQARSHLAAGGSDAGVDVQPAVENPARRPDAADRRAGQGRPVPGAAHAAGPQGPTGAADAVGDDGDGGAAAERELPHRGGRPAARPGPAPLPGAVGDEAAAPGGGGETAGAAPAPGGRLGAGQG